MTPQRKTAGQINKALIDETDARADISKTRADVAETRADVSEVRADTSEALAEAEHTAQGGINKDSTARVDELIDRVGHLATDTEDNTKGLDHVATMIGLVDWRRRRNQILLTVGCALIAIAIVVGIYAITVVRNNNHQAARDRHSQAIFRKEQSEFRAEQRRQGRILVEQNARLENALDPNGCVAARGKAGTQLLILDLKNTIWIANGELDKVQTPPKELTDEASKICPGDPGGPALLDPDGNPVPPPPTTTAPSQPVEDQSASDSAASTGSGTARPATTTSTTIPVPAPVRSAPTTPVTIPTPEGIPQPAPVQVPKPQPLVKAIVELPCRLGVLCNPTANKES